MFLAQFNIVESTIIIESIHTKQNINPPQNALILLMTTNFIILKVVLLYTTN